MWLCKSRISWYLLLRTPPPYTHTTTTLLTLTAVESLDASVISRLPFRPTKAGTRIKTSVIVRNTSQCWKKTKATTSVCDADQSNAVASKGSGFPPRHLLYRCLLCTWGQMLPWAGCILGVKEAVFSLQYSFWSHAQQSTILTGKELSSWGQQKILESHKLKCAFSISQEQHEKWLGFTSQMKYSTLSILCTDTRYRNAYCYRES